MSNYRPDLQPGLGFYCVMGVCFAIPCWWWYFSLVVPVFFQEYVPNSYPPKENYLLLKLVWAGMWSPVFLAPFICPLIGIMGSKTMSKMGL